MGRNREPPSATEPTVHRSQAPPCRDTVTCSDSTDPQETAYRPAHSSLQGDRWLTERDLTTLQRKKSLGYHRRVARLGAPLLAQVSDGRAVVHQETHRLSSILRPPGFHCLENRQEFQSIDIVADGNMLRYHSARESVTS